MTGAPTTADFRPDINALRAFAVLAVVAYHYGLPGVSGGFAGVDVFFVISGFLIGSHLLTSHQRGHFSWVGFFQARVRRIFPALAVMCVACLLWGWWYALPYDYLKSTRHVVAALFFLSNLAFTGEQGYFDVAAHVKPLLHTWSLSVEGQFYLVLPVVMALAWRWARHWLGAILAMLWLASLCWAVWAGYTHPTDAFYSLLARTWEFLSGCLLAVWRPVWRSERLRNLASWGGLWLLISSFVGLLPSLHWPGLWTLMPVAATVVLIAAGAAPATQAVWRAWLLQRLGDVSYSLYLWHWPVWVFGRQLVSSSSGELPPSQRLVLAAVSVLLAVLSWRFVEQPTRQRNGWWTARRLLWGVLVVELLVFGWGVYVVKHQGVPQRLPIYVQQAAQAVFTNTPRDACFRRAQGGKDAPEPYCLFGTQKPQPPSLLLWGDSHANQYLTALTDAATDLNLTGLIATQGACRALLPSQPSHLPDDIAPACEAFNRQVNTMLVQAPQIQTLVIGRVWGGDASLDQTVALVRYWVTQGRRVLLLGPLPEPGLDVPQVWSLQQLQAKHAIPEFTLPLGSQQHVLAMRDKLRVDLAQPLCTGQVLLLDPMQVLCDDQVCRLAEHGQANFRDASHLSQSASLRYTPALRAALAQLQQPVKLPRDASCGAH